MKLKHKLLLSQIAVVIIMFLIITLMLSQIVYTTVSKNDRDNAMILNEQIMTQIDQYFDELERFTSVIADDDQLAVLIGRCIENPTEQNYAKVRLYLSGQVIKNKSKSYAVRGIFIDLGQGENVSDFSTVGFSDNLKMNLREKQNEKGFVLSKGNFIDPFSYDGDSATVFGNNFNMIYGYTMPYKSNGKNGSITVISSFDQIIYLVENMDSYSNDYLLLNETNRIFAPSVTGSKINAENVVRNLTYGKTYMEGYYEEPDAVTTVCYSQHTGWKIMCRLTREDVLSNNHSLIILCEILVALFGGFVVLIMIPFVQKFTAPLSKVSEQMGEIARGNLQARVRINSNDEIAEVGNSFNIMAEKLQENINKMLEQEKREQKMRYSLLISQVDPHFIYNTMNTITYLAQKGRNEDVIAVNKAMIEILKDRLRIDIEDVYDTVFQEIKVTEQYLIIQDYRYAGTFKTVIQVEENVRKYYIAKNIIQPLVENALFHGILCNKDEEGEVIGGCIRINVSLKNSYINITIEDNGTGMPEEVLEELESQSVSKIRGKHIGIRNIKGRIRYIYGEDCSFNISSKEGEGTVVVVKMPVMEEDEANKEKIVHEC